MTASRYFKLSLIVTLLTALLTWFFYAHESLPKPLRAATAIVETPVAIVSGLAYYLGLRISMYDNMVAVILSNFLFSALFIFLADKLFDRHKKGA